METVEPENGEVNVEENEEKQELGEPQEQDNYSSLVDDMLEEGEAEEDSEEAQPKSVHENDEVETLEDEKSQEVPKKKSNDDEVWLCSTIDVVLSSPVVWI